jgi:hypothetical protein
LIPEAFVYHKRRTDFEQFYKQVLNFGKGRALVGKAHPQEVKITHWFPSIFFMGTLAMFFLPLVSLNLFFMAVTVYSIYLLAIFVHALKENRNLSVALLSVPSALLQLFGYGIGFLKEKLKP